jgi:hypothetical protein
MVLCRGKFIESFDWDEVDRLTPILRSMIQNKLSTQERKVLSAICREVTDGVINAKKVDEVSRIFQTNHTHSVLGRLVKKDFLIKVNRSLYAIKDKKIVAHLLVRSCGVKPRR